MNSDLNKKVLQAVNLSPTVDDEFFERLVNMHPMKQIVYASILQFVVFASMFGMFGVISLFIG
jgi:hypothetical protein